MPDQPKEAKSDVVEVSFKLNVNFAAALGVGVTTGFVLHPIDRALYLRSLDSFESRQRLFSLRYFSNPLSGLRNNFYQRSLSCGTYFFMQGALNTHLDPILRSEFNWGAGLSKFTIGMLAGCVQGVIANASYAVKFYTFIHRPQGKPLENAIEMWKRGGFKPFAKGIYAGTARDGLVFGPIYEVTNHLLDTHVVAPLQEKLPENNTIARDLVYLSSRFFSSGLAIAPSSPLNWVRNIQFSTPPEQKQPLSLTLLADAWTECEKAIAASKNKPKSTNPVEAPPTFPRLNFFREKFSVNLGTLRAAFGIAMAQYLFREYSEWIQHHSKSVQPKRLSP